MIKELLDRLILGETVYVIVPSHQMVDFTMAVACDMAEERGLDYIEIRKARSVLEVERRGKAIFRSEQGLMETMLRGLPRDQVMVHEGCSATTKAIVSEMNDEFSEAL